MSAHEMHGFLPDDYVERKAQMRTNILWALIFMIVAGGIGAAFFIAEKKVRAAEAMNKSVADEFAAAAKPIEQFQHVQEEQARLNRQAELAHSLVEKVNRSNILAELTNCLPKGVYLVDLGLEGRRRADDASPLRRAEAAKPGAALASAKPIIYDVTIHLSGLAYTDTQVDDYMKALGNNPLFKKPKFLSTQETTYLQRKVRSFELELALDPAADSHGPLQQPSAKAQ